MRLSKQTPRQEFEEFKRECEKWIKFFGLTDFQIYYEHRPMKDCFGQCDIDVPGRVCTIALSNNVTEENEPFKHISTTAFHEVLHVFFAKITHLATCRYCQPEEIREEEEGLIRRFENTVYPIVKNRVK